MIKSLGKIIPETSALFICDVQSKFANHIFKFNGVVNQSKYMMRVCNELKVPIIFTEQYPKGLGHTIEDLLKERSEQHQSKIFEKTLYSMCTNEVLNHLKQNHKDLKSILITGIETHVCVLQSTLDFLENGYDVHILSDAVSSNNNNDRLVALERMRQSGAFITTTESVIFQLTRDATHKSFKMKPSSTQLFSLLSNKYNTNSFTTTKIQQQQQQQKQQQHHDQTTPPQPPSNPKKTNKDRIKDILRKTAITPQIFLKVLEKFAKSYKKTIAFILGVIAFLIYSYETPDSYFGSMMNVMVRFYRTMYCAARIMVNYKILSYTPEDSVEYLEKSKMCHQESAELILELCLTNGGLYIKAGQYIASLNHILPIQYTKTLTVLQDQAPWRDFYEVESVFIKDLGNPPNHYFSDFDKLPIAAASLAQVHRAITKEGEEVAVKVQYVDLQRNFDGDILTHNCLLTLINMAFPDFEFNWMAEEMKTVLIKELDFCQEADNAERAAADLSNNKSAYIPKVFRPYSSKRILTSEFIHGCKINNVQAIRAMGLSEKTVSQRFIEIMCEQIFIHAFVHVDPHAGNVLVRQNPNNLSQPQIVLLDHGLYREYGEEFRLNFCNLYKNLVLCNNRKVEKYSKALGVQNWKLFSTMILMRNFEGSSVGLSNSISSEDLEKLLSGALERIKDINLLMKAMPRHLLLILRNNNLLRSINMELGSPVNRFSIMARYAAKGLNSNTSKNSGIIRFVKRVEEKVSLEVMLKGYEIYYYIANRILSILIRLHLINPEKLIKDQMKKLG
ncbi:hypothetical protein RB653_000923 [Dictyostelium firmibasis]|uniref:Uncharacterized protein n=1 Tax=Dictyostelium firmibasis TaxID=79012 RepID=A0AAN7TW19_9MYCE